MAESDITFWEFILKTLSNFLFKEWKTVLETKMGHSYFLKMSLGLVPNVKYLHFIQTDLSWEGVSWKKKQMSVQKETKSWAS